MLYIEIGDVTPLYKLLCLTLMVLTPLLPAWILFKIAPEDKILAVGSFAGFKINATGAVGIYIVLFAAFFSKTDGIFKSLDSDMNKAVMNENKGFRDQIVTLKKQIPWRVACTVKILEADNSEIAKSEYYNCLNPESIKPYPDLLSTNSGTKTVTFYLDDDVLQTNKNSCSLTFSQIGAAANLVILKENMNQDKKEIVLSTVINRINSANYLKNKSSSTANYKKSSGQDVPIANLAPITN